MADEIQAMGAIDKAMQGLDTDAHKRVLRWAADKFGGGDVNIESESKSRIDTRARGKAEHSDVGDYERISDLMDSASPQTGVDHVLVASYWFQAIKGQDSFTSQEVNAELKDLGHGAKNITDAYSSLMERKPPAARQVQKSGSTRQARKRYRLTEVGVRAVDRMLRGEAGE